MDISGAKAGRDPPSIEISLTIERSLPINEAESQQFVEDLMRCMRNLAVLIFVMDFGQSTIHRTQCFDFVEQVIHAFNFEVDQQA